MEATFEPASLKLKAAPPAKTPVPEGFGLDFDRATRLDAPVHTIVGGSPLVILKLSPLAISLVQQWQQGALLSESVAARQVARRLLTTGIAHPVPPSTTGPLSLSIVIPVRNRPALLNAVLERVAGLDVVVVDDASDDGSEVARIATNHGARLVRSNKVLGPAGARNLGLRAVHSEFVAFVDSDVDVDAASLTTLCGHFADPLVGAVAPRVGLSAGVANGAIARYEAVRSPLDLGNFSARVAPRANVSYVPTAALVVRRSLGDVLFDETMRTGEDVDLVWRLVDAGWTVRYDPSVVVHHPARSTLRAFVNQRFSYGQSAAPLATRHGDAAAPVATSAFTAAAWGAALLGEPVGSLFSLGGATVLLSRKLSSMSSKPWRDAASMVGLGSLRAGPSLGRQVFRTYGAVLVGASLRSRRTRFLTTTVALLPALIDWKASARSLDPARFVALSILDDLSYGAGVLSGAVGERSLLALRPVISLGAGKGASTRETNLVVSRT